MVEPEVTKQTGTTKYAPTIRNIYGIIITKNKLKYTKLV